MSKSSASTSFAASFAGALRAAGIFKSELARRVGCNRGRISEYVSGRKVPRRGMLERINAVLGSELAPERPISVKDVARDYRCGVAKVRRALKGGQLSMLGIAVPSPSGKRHSFMIHPQAFKELVNASA